MRRDDASLPGSALGRQPLTSADLIETRVRVVGVTPGRILVEPLQSNGCGACHVRSACGIGGLARHLRIGRQPIAVPCPLPARVGDELVFAIAPRDLIKAGLLAYLLPAALGVLAAGLIASQSPSDGAAALGLLAGTASGLYLARRYGRRIPLSVHPRSASTVKGENP